MQNTNYFNQSNIPLTLIWVGFLGGSKITPLPPSKTCSNYAGNFKFGTQVHTHIVSENIPFRSQVPLILLTSAFFCKKLAFFVQNSIFTQSTSVRAVLEIFQFCSQFSVFVRQKVTDTENITFSDCVSGIRLPDCPKLAINPKNDNDVTIFRHDVNVKFFDVVLFLLSSLVTGPSFMSISSLVLVL